MQEKAEILSTKSETVKKQTEIPRLKNSFGTALTNGNDLANLLNYKFSALGKKEEYQFCNNAARHSYNFIFRYTTTEEIFDILNNFNVKKPLGPSLIPACALKDARELIAEPPIPEDPINYRPILLSGALAKIFEILRDQILAYLEKNKLLATTVWI